MRREAHAHLPHLGAALEYVSLADCTSASEALDRLAERAGSLAPDEWLIALHARPEGWPERGWPERAELERAVGPRPCCVWCFDYHAMLASGPALERAGVGERTPDPDGGVIVRDANGRPTGVMLEAAAHLVRHAVPEPTPEQRIAHVRAALAHLAALGFEETHDLHSPAWLGPMLAAISDEGELPMRVKLFAPQAELEQHARAEHEWRRERVRLAGGKIFTDGTLNSRTAWMLEPYADPLPDHPRGTPMMSEDAIRQAVRQADALGLPLAAHAIGDGAVRAVLDAIETEQPRTPGFRIEHAELIDPADVPRFAGQGVIASVQPCHLLADVEALHRRVPDRLDRVLPLRDLIDHGCEPGLDAPGGLLFGSDIPIVRANPEDSVRAAVHRRRTGAPEPDAIAPRQAIREDEAWACFASRA